MSDSNKVSEKDLRKLEDEAYFELCQIIAEAMQLQDVDLLNAEIASWKTKYKKLLDSPSTPSKSNFKKRIEFLLNQYYSSVTQYILNQLKLKEQKMIENQAKALKELYRTIKNTNDYDLLKNKVKKWKEKYHIDGFLRMYQKRIKFYTRDKTIRESSFKQEEAFSDLVDITKKHATLDELNVMIEDWEKKYSINDKYSIDDFLKHQSEIKRFTSDEFLQKIAREDLEPDNIDETDIVENYNKSFSNLSVQANAYATLLKISKSPNAVNEMFAWVYKNSHIKFNDKYKELILNATYLEYSPTYLNKLDKPKMDMSKSSLSFDEYKHIDDIKRYAIISYFNLLLPPGKAISNDYFTKNVQIVYAKSEKARTASKMKEDTSSLNIDDMLDYGLEVSLNKPNAVSLESPDITEEIKDNDIIEACEEIVVDQVDISENNSKEQNPKIEDVINSSEIEQASSTAMEDIKGTSNDKVESIEKKPTEKDELMANVKSDKQKNEEIEFISEPYKESKNSEIDMSSRSLPALENQKTDLDYDTVIALSPLFITAVNNLDKQATIVDHIDSDTTKYIETEKEYNIESSITAKTKIDVE